MQEAIIHQSRVLRGSVQPPADKSIAQRAVLLAAIAEGETQLTPVTDAQDCQRAVAVARALGAKIVSTEQGLSVKGCGAAGLVRPKGVLDCGESGTTLRLCAGILAGQVFRATLSGDASLCRRPMGRIAEPLIQMGAMVKGERSIDGKKLFPPLEIEGRRPLRAIRYPLPVASAQVKSAVLMAGLYAEGITRVIEPVSTRDHTERLLLRFGATLECSGRQIDITGLGRTTLKSPGSLEIPGDISGAAFFAVAACGIEGSQVDLKRIGLNPTRVGLLRALERMGAALVWEEASSDDWEPLGDVRIRGSSLRPISIGPDDVPALIDELPVLLVAACRASGTSVFRGVGELRVKETDRIHSMVEGLTRLGARVEVNAEDTVRVTGGSLRGATVESYGDHRTAMALAVAGLFAEGTTRIRDVGCVAKSFPDFFELLKKLAGSATVMVKTVR